VVKRAEKKSFKKRRGEKNRNTILKGKQKTATFAKHELGPKIHKRYRMWLKEFPIIEIKKTGDLG